MSHLKKGDKAPDFTAPIQTGEERSLSDYQGKKLVFYFYPKDNTPTCTKEACNLRDNYKALQKAGYEILGVSADSAKKHTNFINKFELPFDLLVDADNSIAKAYGAWGQKQMFGKQYEGILRTTFLIDETGKIESVIQKVKSTEHANQILGVESE